MALWKRAFDIKAAGTNKSGTRIHGIPDTARNIMVIVVGEFCGTFMFLLLAFIGAQTAIDTNNTSPGADPTAPLLPQSLMYIAASYSCALVVNVWIFYRITGGIFNPAVSIQSLYPCEMLTVTR